jgi:hypothetical protein
MRFCAVAAPGQQLAQLLIVGQKPIVELQTVKEASSRISASHEDQRNIVRRSSRRGHHAYLQVVHVEVAVHQLSDPVRADPCAGIGAARLHAVLRAAARLPALATTGKRLGYRPTATADATTRRPRLHMHFRVALFRQRQACGSANCVVPRDQRISSPSSTTRFTFVLAHCSFCRRLRCH